MLKAIEMKLIIYSIEQPTYRAGLIRSTRKPRPEWIQAVVKPCLKHQTSQPSLKFLIKVHVFPSVKKGVRKELIKN